MVSLLETMLAEVLPMTGRNMKQLRDVLTQLASDNGIVAEPDEDLTDLTNRIILAFRKGRHTPKAWKLMGGMLQHLKVVGIEWDNSLIPISTRKAMGLSEHWMASGGVGESIEERKGMTMGPFETQVERSFTETPIRLQPGNLRDSMRAATRPLSVPLIEIAAGKFSLGRIVATPGALRELKDAGDKAATFLARHVKGDWGDVSSSDARLNDQAVKKGERILSSYVLSNGSKLWIITEWDRSATTLLLPSEY